jgi:hypothetical protein
MDKLDSVIIAKRRSLGSRIERSISAGQTAQTAALMEELRAFENSLVDLSADDAIAMVRAYAKQLRTDAGYSGAMHDGGASLYSEYADAYEAGYKRGLSEARIRG